MTDEEIEIVAQELAKVGGVAWYPGRSRGSLLRSVSERYKDRAKVAIAALDRLRAGKEGQPLPQDPVSETLMSREGSQPAGEDQPRVGAIVVYRPPGDQRAVPCRIEKLEEGRAYLVPCPRPDIGWVSFDTLQEMSVESDANAVNPNG